MNPIKMQISIDHYLIKDFSTVPSKQQSAIFESAKKNNCRTVTERTANMFFIYGDYFDLHMFVWDLSFNYDIEVS